MKKEQRGGGGTENEKIRLVTCPKRVCLSLGLSGQFDRSNFLFKFWHFLARAWFNRCVKGLCDEKNKT